MTDNVNRTQGGQPDGRGDEALAARYPTMHGKDGPAPPGPNKFEQDRAARLEARYPKMHGKDSSAPPGPSRFAQERAARLDARYPKMHEESASSQRGPTQQQVERAAKLAARYPEMRVEGASPPAGAAGELGPAKPGDAAAPQNPTTTVVVPEKYELDADVEVDHEILDAVTPGFREAGLSQKQFAAVVRAHNKILERQRETWQKTLTTWEETARADPEFGGDRFDDNLRTARAVLARYGTPEVGKAISETGFGNHPEAIRLFVRVARALGIR